MERMKGLEFARVRHMARVVETHYRAHPLGEVAGSRH